MKNCVVYVVSVGVDRYEPGIGELSCAARDARKLDALFEHKFGFTVKYLDQNNLDSGVIERAIEVARQTLESAGGGLFVFYFSGHGKQQGGDQIMLLPGARRALLERGNTRTSGVFSYNTLLDLTLGWRGVDRFFIFDSCRQLLPTKSGNAVPAFEGIGVARDPTLASKAAWERERDFTELNSCGPGEVSLELPESKGGPGHGVFSLALLEALGQAESAVRIDSGFVAELQSRMNIINETYGLRQSGRPTLIGKPLLLRAKAAPADPNSLSPDLAEHLDERLWRLACMKDNIESYEAHLHDNRYACSHVDAALGRIAELQARTAGDGETGGGMVGRPDPGSTFTDSVTGMEFIYVPGECYQMGDVFGDGNKDEKPVHRECVGDFWMGRYEVTQGEWERVMGENPSFFKQGPCFPVENIRWDDCQAFIQKLNLLSGKEYRLPTEAEWEYAARSGGKEEKWAGTCDEARLPEYAWYQHADGLPHKVGAGKPNGLGLYDMSGNVWEWCADAYGAYVGQSADTANDSLVEGGRVIRGGSWRNDRQQLRTSNRLGYLPDNRFAIGFRLVLPVEQE